MREKSLSSSKELLNELMTCSGVRHVFQPEPCTGMTPKSFVACHKDRSCMVAGMRSKAALTDSGDTTFPAHKLSTIAVRIGSLRAASFQRSAARAVNAPVSQRAPQAFSRLASDGEACSTSLANDKTLPSTLGPRTTIRSPYSTPVIAAPAMTIGVVFFFNDTATTEPARTLAPGT